MSKKESKQTAAHSATEKMTRALNAAATDDQNLNHNHNTKKEACGPNTRK